MERYTDRCAYNMQVGDYGLAEWTQEPFKSHVPVVVVCLTLFLSLGLTCRRLKRCASEWDGLMPANAYRSSRPA